MSDYIVTGYVNLELPPPPPRNNKDPESNFYSYTQWMVDFYRSATLNGYYISRNESVLYKEFDGNNLIEPVDATIATAQDTANNAYNLAKTANDAVDEFDNWVHGQVTISDTGTTGSVSFDSEQPDASYVIVASVGASSGAGLPAECFLITGITSLASTGFTINIHTAPGAGNTVTYNWALRR